MNVCDACVCVSISVCINRCSLFMHVLEVYVKSCVGVGACVFVCVMFVLRKCVGVGACVFVFVRVCATGKTTEGRGGRQT